jgi:hypothetical protein
MLVLEMAVVYPNKRCRFSIYAHNGVSMC